VQYANQKIKNHLLTSGFLQKNAPYELNSFGQDQTPRGKISCKQHHFVTALA